MTNNFYRFPAMTNIQFDPQAQLHKIGEEVKEAIQACGDLGIACIDYGCASDEAVEAATNYGMELMDVIHAAETALRIDFTEDEVNNFRKLTEAKNRKRGYYDD